MRKRAHSWRPEDCLADVNEQELAKDSSDATEEYPILPTEKNQHNTEKKERNTKPMNKKPSGAGEGTIAVVFMLFCLVAAVTVLVSAMLGQGDDSDMDGDSSLVGVTVLSGGDLDEISLRLEEVLELLQTLKKSDDSNTEQPTDTASAARLGVACESVSDGLRIVSFESETADVAQKLRVGDVIVAVGETEISTAEELSEVVREYSAGESAEIFVWRDGQTLSFFVELYS